MSVNYIPTGFHTVTPYLVVEGAARLIEFLKQAFGAEVILHMPMPDGKVAHAEVRIGDSPIEISDASPQYPARSAMLHLYVPDCDAVYQRALDVGATSVRPLKDEFYGDRTGGVQDPCGNQWFIATHKVDMTQEELQRKMAEMSVAA